MSGKYKRKWDGCYLRGLSVLSSVVMLNVLCEAIKLKSKHLSTCKNLLQLNPFAHIIISIYRRYKQSIIGWRNRFCSVKCGACGGG